MALSLNKTQLIELLPLCTTLTSEAGWVSGPGYRERYLTPDGYYLDVAYYAGDIVAWAIRARRCRNWQVEA